MQIKHITRIRFASRRTPEKKRHLTVCLCMFRKVVKDNQCMPPGIPKKFAHGRTGIRCNELHRRRIVCGRMDDNGIIHSPRLFEIRNNLCYRRTFLTDGDINTIDRFDSIFFCFFRMGILLIDDGIESNSRFSGLAVADNQFTLTAADGPRITYSKSFPGSNPAFVQLTLVRSGDVEYREAADEDDPIEFKLNEAETAEVFTLAEKLDHFKRPLETPIKVAFMGAKTLRWEDGAEKNEVKFNYSSDEPARELVDWFERMAESARYNADLERAVKYDKLGVVSAVTQIESALRDKRLVGGEQFLPMLDRVINNDSYMHTARERATAVAAAIRGAKK